MKSISLHLLQFDCEPAKNEDLNPFTKKKKAPV